MRFYSGFSLKDEHHFFDAYIKDFEYTVCGFSYGAIRAFRYVQECLKESKRVDTLQLFSPAFFEKREEKFKKLQLFGYKKDKDLYIEEFSKSCFLPYNQKRVEHNSSDTIEELQDLLYYKWSIEELKELVCGGVKIEVYLGSKDKIIDVASARELFLQVATVTYIKEANHFLLTS